MIHFPLAVTCWICCWAWRGFTSQRCLRLINETPPPSTHLTTLLSLQLSAAVDKPRMAYWKQAYELKAWQTDWLTSRGKARRTDGETNWGGRELTNWQTDRIVAAQKSNWSMNWNWNWSRKQRVLKPSCALRPDGGNAIKYPASWVNRRYRYICSMLSIHKGRFRYGGNSIWMFEGLAGSAETCPMNNADYFDAKWHVDILFVTLKQTLPVKHMKTLQANIIYKMQVYILKYFAFRGSRIPCGSRLSINLVTHCVYATCLRSAFLGFQQSPWPIFTLPK